MKERRNDTIQLELSAEELATLVRYVYLGDWVATAHLVQEPGEIGERATSRIYAAAHAAGLRELVDHATADRLPEPTVELEEELQETLEDFKQRNADEYLAETLATVELIKTYGLAKLNRMEPEKRALEALQCEEEWAEWLDEHYDEMLATIYALRQRPKSP